MNSPLPLSISPCPNDTFAFYRLFKKTAKSYTLQTHFQDIALLNQRLLQTPACGGILKASFYAWFHRKTDYDLLPVGAALGFQGGPLIVSRPETPCFQTIAIPGPWTTATLLVQLFFDTPLKMIEAPFHQIPLLVQQKKVDAGVIIHETRFTYSQYGLKKRIDLNEWWKEKTGGLPLPLGGIFASKQIPKNIVQDFSEDLKESITWAWKHEKETLEFCKEYAQEQEPSILKKHVALFVNAFTHDLGEEGKEAILCLERLAKEKGLLRVREP